MIVICQQHSEGNPRRGQGNVSVVSSKEGHPHGSFICSGNCHQVEGTYMLDRLSGDDDDLEVLRPMLSNGHIILSSQRIYHQNGRQACPVTSETLNLDSDLSNHSASSGFVDSSSQPEEIPVSRSAIKHSDDTPQTPEAVPLTTVDSVPAQQCDTQGYADHSQDTVFADSIPDDGSGDTARDICDTWTQRWKAEVERLKCPSWRGC
ncbi:hypothetical protein BSL78_13182 [Apostichopus japonicus]|uniref:Uncharacterized protein n=1 Tax=Stichopus japonicus TaxID=307972 RepID=A0A2G8KPS6_STIJA|nr:hypothetical protein BSL78_13182 [Apostichopus japonicus]